MNQQQNNLSFNPSQFTFNSANSSVDNQMQNINYESAPRQMQNIPNRGANRGRRRNFRGRNFANFGNRQGGGRKRRKRIQVRRNPILPSWRPIIPALSDRTVGVNLQVYRVKKDGTKANHSDTIEVNCLYYNRFGKRCSLSAIGFQLMDVSGQLADKHVSFKLEKDSRWISDLNGQQIPVGPGYIKSLLSRSATPLIMELANTDQNPPKIISIKSKTPVKINPPCKIMGCVLPNGDSEHTMRISILGCNYKLSGLPKYTPGTRLQGTLNADKTSSWTVITPGFVDKTLLISLSMKGDVGDVAYSSGEECDE